MSLIYDKKTTILEDGANSNTLLKYGTIDQSEEEDDEHWPEKKGKETSTDRDEVDELFLLDELNDKEMSVIKDVVTNLQPSSMSQQLDVMAARLTLNFDSKNSDHIHALKLCLSKVVNIFNHRMLSICKLHIKDPMFWVKVKGINCVQANPMSDYVNESAKELHFY